MKVSHIEGAILVGGASRRMGRDKASARFAGVPMVQRVAHALGECLERVRVVVRPGEKSPIGLPVIEDGHQVRAPLVGLCAALHACEASAVLLAATDLAELDPRVVLALISAMPADEGPIIVAPLGPRGPEPLLAIYRPSLLQRIERQLRTNDLSLMKLLRSVDTHYLPEAALRELDPELRSLRNVNRPEDLR